MSISDDINNLIRGKVVIRHRNEEELGGIEASCMICLRSITLPPGSVCLFINDEGLLCPVCADHYAPEMTRMLNQDVVVKENKSVTYSEINYGAAHSTVEEEQLRDDIQKLIEVTDSLSRGIARGIIEAPAGHIGLMHYAKDIRKPPLREGESEKDYELRVRSFRISRLYEKIHADTTERVERIEKFLREKGIGVL